MRDCEPFSECWCEQNPSACGNTNNIPVNNGLILCVVFALVYGIVKLYRYKKSN